MTGPELDLTSQAQQTQVRVRFFAAAAEAAGTHSQTYALPSNPTAADLVTALTAEHGPELGRILSISSLLVAGTTVEDQTALLTDHNVDVLPPFAGG